MEKLTQIQIEMGLEHWFKYELPEYAGGKELSINCTQLDGYPYNPKYKSAREKKRVLSEWCEFLIENPHAFTSLSFGTRMPQELYKS